MNTQMNRADEIVDILGDDDLDFDMIIQVLKKRHPKTSIDKLRASPRAALAKNPDRFERDGENYRVRTAPIVYQGKWPTKKAFILDHLNLSVDAVIEKGASHGIKLTKGVGSTVRSDAAKHGHDTEISTEQIKTTTTLVRHTETNVSRTTMVSAAHDNSLDDLLHAAIDREMSIGNFREKIREAVRARIQVLAQPKIESLVREIAEIESKEFFSNM